MQDRRCFGNRSPRSCVLGVLCTGPALEPLLLANDRGLRRGNFEPHQPVI
jgi:hypothetical protein